MKGKDLEKICIARMLQEEKLGHATMGRYGVQGSMRKGEPIEPHDWVPRMLSASETGHLSFAIAELIAAAKASADGWHPLQSLPDFEGLLFPRGTQFIFDAKVCGAASYQIDKGSRTQSRQLLHMLKRARFGAICFYLIHFTERQLAKSIEPPATWAFPIHPELSFWESFDRGESKRISRADCEEYGVETQWNVLPGGRTPRPDILTAIYELAAKVKS